MNVAQRLETLYHEIMLRNCKNEEERKWEVSRHIIMAASITDSCNYYGSRSCEKEYEELER